MQPGAPGEAGRPVSAVAARDLSGVRFTAADVRFMQGMLSHHAQAIEMTDLVETRAERADVRLLAHRIADSQADEIRMMRAWLAARGQVVPDEHADHMRGAAMPGMLTPDEMDRLRAAAGAQFDRLFLELMIKHHEGAITMVRALYATDGAGQESEIDAFASDVVADQQIEIRRMREMLHAR